MKAASLPQDVHNLSQEIEFMSGFEVVEDQLLVNRELMGEVIQDKRRRERSRFKLAENVMVIHEFHNRYASFARIIYGAMCAIKGIVEAKE